MIGLETHVELSTNSKMFCRCPVDVDGEPNTACCPVCLALPGALPVPNEKAIEGIVMIGLALDCEINERSLFYRKNYFYPGPPEELPDQPVHLPVCEHGSIDIDVDGSPTTVGITRVHMEEDTGKSTHVGDGGGRIHDADHTLLDFNRAGVPLVEVVTEPDIRSPEQARAYGAELQRIVLALGVSDAKLEAGSMRFDANVSVRKSVIPNSGRAPKPRTSTRFAACSEPSPTRSNGRSLSSRMAGSIHQETRHWNESTGKTAAMRSKEESEDYRYFQDPDLLPLSVSQEWQASIRETIPELPAARRARYVAAGADLVPAELLADSEGLSDLFEGAVAAGADGRTAAIWLTGDVVAHLRRNDRDVAESSLAAAHLADLTAMVDAGELSSSAAKEVLVAAMDDGGDVRAIAEERDLMQVSDVSAIEDAVDSVLAENPDAVAKIASGDMKPIGFLVGQVMRVTGGKADPKVVQQVLRDRTG